MWCINVSDIPLSSACTILENSDEINMFKTNYNYTAWDKLVFFCLECWSTGCHYHVYITHYFVLSERNRLTYTNEALPDPWCLENIVTSDTDYEALIQCWSDAGPASTTLDQHQFNTGSTSRVCWVPSLNKDIATSDIFETIWQRHASGARCFADASVFHTL